jgi:hypothetical protein
VSARLILAAQPTTAGAAVGTQGEDGAEDSTPAAA